MTTCLTGLDRLFEDGTGRFRGLRVGLIANPASVDRQLVHAVERFANCREWRFTAIFGPQHGVRADRQDNMIESPDEIDPRWGIPVYSLYKQERKPTAAMLEDVDVLFCDLFDVGTRSYTFVWTAMLAMEACAENRRRFVVLDRPNPIGGSDVEGPVLDPAYRSFVGLYPVPMRHGFTMGELASFVNTEFGIGADLEVIEIANWNRAQWLDQTELAWVMPSPNMPTLTTAAVYPGTVLVEGTNLSEGRGTTRPFELVGAPFLDGEKLAGCLNALRLPGVRFRAAWFRPTFDKWCGQLCGGVQIHITDGFSFQPFRTGLAVIRAARELAPREFAWRQPPFEYEYAKLPFDILSGTARLRGQVERSAGLDSMAATWQPGLLSFRSARSRYLRYP
jgi:uncharacterized protein YbbC (DUF1343 family)